MRFKNPRLTVDGVVLKDGSIVLVKRKNNPFKGCWALPGGFVGYGEKVEDAVLREVFEETGLKCKVRGLVGVYSDPDRDPRGHTVSIVFLLERGGGELLGGDDALEARFFSLDDLPDLSFDHGKIINDVIKEV